MLQRHKLVYMCISQPFAICWQFRFYSLLCVSLLLHHIELYTCVHTFTAEWRREFDTFFIRSPAFWSVKTEKENFRQIFHFVECQRKERKVLMENVEFEIAISRNMLLAVDAQHDKLCSECELYVSVRWSMCAWSNNESSSFERNKWLQTFSVKLVQPTAFISNLLTWKA